MRIFCDQNVMTETVDYLRSLGHDVGSTRDSGLATASDAEVLRTAIQQERVLLTYNADFSDIRSFPLESHSGIIRLRLVDQTAEKMHPILGNVLRQLENKDISGKLVTVGRTNVRIRAE